MTNRAASSLFAALLLLFIVSCTDRNQLWPLSGLRPTTTFSFLKEETFCCGGRTNTVRIYCHKQTGLEFALVPAGTFLMGSADTEEGRDDNEGPQRRIMVKPFLICRTEVTQKAWENVTWKTPSYFKGDDFPVENIYWDNCQKFCAKVGLRIPTEAEWEYACRAGTTTRYNWGNAFAQGHCNAENDEHYWTNGLQVQYFRSCGMPINQTMPVRGFKPNAFGLFDMHGNVDEWCLKDSSGDPILRGGAYNNLARACRSASRQEFSVRLRGRFLGLRPACSLTHAFLE